MSQLLRRTLCCLLFVGLAAGALATTATADPLDVSGGDLYGVYAQSGSFGTSATYTIVHHVAFETSDFDQSLVPASLPAGEFSASGLFPAGTEFFLLGALQGAEGYGNHVMLSSGPGGGSGFLDETFHSQLVSGVQALALQTPQQGMPDGVFQMSSTDFWLLMGGAANEAAFFDLSVMGQSPLSRLEREGDPIPEGGEVEEDSYNFVAGSEDLFGYSVGGTYLGYLGNSSTGASFTDAQGNTTYAVPEPASFALVLGALVVGGATRRRRRRAA